ncbi:MAG: ApaLI family restriction endonuclease [Magnetococcales bacterium]|nr:ApaLI family restriction endonuclease [Magnetococcales bacterium]
MADSVILYQEIRSLSDDYESRLKERISARVLEMESDDRLHHVLYQVLGVTAREGYDIDVYQNKGRFLYKYAGAFLESAARLCIEYKHPGARRIKITNTLGQRPATFEIDALLPSGDAFEIKWRDATTDGDHITKEHTRLKVIANAGYRPVRLMFYYPNRDHAKRIQKTLETLDAGVGGHYYCGDAAWNYIDKNTGVDLLAVLNRIALEKTHGQ